MTGAHYLPGGGTPYSPRQGAHYLPGEGTPDSPRQGRHTDPQKGVIGHLPLLQHVSLLIHYSYHTVTYTPPDTPTAAPTQTIERNIHILRFCTTT